MELILSLSRIYLEQTIAYGFVLLYLEQALAYGFMYSREVVRNPPNIEPPPWQGRWRQPVARLIFTVTQRGIRKGGSERQIPEKSL